MTDEVRLREIEERAFEELMTPNAIQYGNTQGDRKDRAPARHGFAEGARWEHARELEASNG